MPYRLDFPGQNQEMIPDAQSHGRSYEQHYGDE